MITELQITWEKLNLEMDLINLEDPNSLGPLLIGFNALMSPGPKRLDLSSRLSFMSFELVSKCEELEESNRLHALNSYFFDEKQFQILPVNSTAKIESPWMLDFILNQSAGAPLGIALLYLHFASQLHIPIYLVKHESYCLLKWIRSKNKVNYVDLMRGGKILTELEVFDILNSTKENERNELLEILPSKIILKYYFEQIYPVCLEQHKIESCHILLNLILKLDSQDLDSISRRAIIRKQLGLNKEALADLKKYFSFVERSHAPKELKTAYYELQAFEARLKALPPEDSLH